MSKYTDETTCSEYDLLQAIKQNSHICAEMVSGTNRKHARHASNEY